MWDEIVKGNSICIYGPRGVGKTYLLRKIVSQFNGVIIRYWTANNILKALLRSVGIKPAGTIEDMYRIVRRFVRGYVIGIDDYHQLGKLARRIVLALRENNVVIVTSLHPESGFVNVALRPSYKRCIAALSAFPLREEDKKLIVEHACGLPKEAIRIAKYFMNGFKLREIRPGIAKINLLDLETTLVLALALIFLKYLLYYKASFKEAYIVAMLAYGSLVIFHLIRKLNKWQ